MQKITLEEDAVAAAEREPPAPRAVRPFNRAFDDEDVKDLLPPGFTISFEERNERWAVKCGRWRRSRQAGPITGDDKWSALVHVITLAWGHNVRLGNAGCPFVFEA